MKNHKLSKAISDVCWSKFINTLEYKALWNDKSVVHMNYYDTKDGVVSTPQTQCNHSL